MPDRDLQNKVFLVTGATSGIGLAASVEFARRGAQVAMVGRDRTRLESAVAEVTAKSGSRELSPFLCDFALAAQLRYLTNAAGTREILNDRPQTRAFLERLPQVRR